MTPAAGRELLGTSRCWRRWRPVLDWLEKASPLDRRQFARLLAKAESAEVATSIRVALLSDASLENVAEPLALQLCERGLLGIQYYSPFGQLGEEVRNPGSGLRRSDPEFVVLAPLTNLWQRPGILALSPEEIVAEVWGHHSALRQFFKGPVAIVNVVPTEQRPHGMLDGRQPTSRSQLARRLNYLLEERARLETGTYILEADLLANLAGTRWHSLHKPRFLAGRPLADGLAELLAGEIAALAAALKGLSRKCLILDLDNTLWGGVLGEDGATGVQIGASFPGNVFLALQEEILRLRQRGVILAIASKNNLSDVQELFATRTELALKFTDFSCHRIGWGDKATSIREIALELNLGLDALVFLDDNPAERHWVRENLPEVDVCPCSDPLEMLRWLVQSKRFETLGTTLEDSLRASSYAAAPARAAFSSQSANLEDYLHGLSVELTISVDDRAEIARVAQLTQKTNQFNLTSRRCTESDIESFVQSSQWRVFTGRVKDRFADEGTVAVGILHNDARGWLVHTFLLSCRVLGRGVEHAFLAAICRYLEAEGIGQLQADFFPTAKNAPAASFLPSCGFVVGDPHWTLFLPAAERLRPSWVAILQK